MRSTVCFRSRIEIRGINPFVVVSKDRAEQCKPGWRRPLPVLVRLNGTPSAGSRTNLMPTGSGDYFLYLNGTMRRCAQVDVGDAVTVELTFDDAYRGGPQHPMPATFRSMLDENAAAKRNWQALSPSRKKEILRYFAQVASPEAKLRNYARAVAVLGGEAARFMGRAWENGS